LCAVIVLTNVRNCIEIKLNFLGLHQDVKAFLRFRDGVTSRNVGILSPRKLEIGLHALQTTTSFGQQWGHRQGCKIPSLHQKASNEIKEPSEPINRCKGTIDKQHWI